MVVTSDIDVTRYGTDLKHEENMPVGSLVHLASL